jgi:hypothetical protein
MLFQIFRDYVCFPIHTNCYLCYFLQFDVQLLQRPIKRILENLFEFKGEFTFCDSVRGDIDCIPIPFCFFFWDEKVESKGQEGEDE